MEIELTEENLLEVFLEYFQVSSLLRYDKKTHMFEPIDPSIGSPVQAEARMTNFQWSNYLKTHTAFFSKGLFKKSTFISDINSPEHERFTSGHIDAMVDRKNTYTCDSEPRMRKFPLPIVSLDKEETIQVLAFFRDAEEMSHEDAMIVYKLDKALEESTRRW